MVQVTYVSFNNNFQIVKYGFRVHTKVFIDVSDALSERLLIITANVPLWILTNFERTLVAFARKKKKPYGTCRKLQ